MQIRPSAIADVSVRLDRRGLSLQAIITSVVPDNVFIDIQDPPFHLDMYGVPRFNTAIIRSRILFMQAIRTFFFPMESTWDP